MRFFMPKNVGAICTSGLLAVNRQKTLKQKENVNMKENAKTEPLKYHELRELEAKYPEYSRYKILALSLMRYGAVLDREAEKRMAEPDLSFNVESAFGLQFGDKEVQAMPGPILLQDQSFVYINWGEPYEDPYIVTYDPEKKKFHLLDHGIFIDEIEFIPRPAFFDKKTSRGTPMAAIADVRMHDVIMTTYRRCAFRDMGCACKFCAFFTGYLDRADVEVDPEDAYEVVREALKEDGRFTHVQLSGGTDLGGSVRFEREAERYIRQWQAIGRNFSGRFPAELMAPAWPKKLLQKVYDETKITEYSPNLEIPSEKVFRAYCPGKDKYVGFENWIGRTVEAVDVFGPGKVSTSLVAGAELVGPNAISEEESLEAHFRMCDYLTRNGVVYNATVWRPHRACGLGYAPMADLEYYVRLMKGVDDISRANHLEK